MVIIEGNEYGREKRYCSKLKTSLKKINSWSFRKATALRVHIKVVCIPFIKLLPSQCNLSSNDFKDRAHYFSLLLFNPVFHILLSPEIMKGLLSSKRKFLILFANLSKLKRFAINDFPLLQFKLRCFNYA